MRRKTFAVVAIIYAVALVCWTVLAVAFQKWWIALFALLFFPSVKEYRATKCDGCGVQLAHESEETRYADLRHAGWVRELDASGRWLDLCPTCQRRRGDPFMEDRE